MLSIFFYIFICQLYALFGEVPIQNFCPFVTVFFIVSFNRSLYILDISSLSDMCFTQIFCQSVACLYFLNSFFCRAEVLNLNEVQIINYFFVMGRALFVRSKSHWQTPDHLNFLLFYFLEIWYFCILHFYIWSILSSFLWRLQISA